MVKRGARYGPLNRRRLPWRSRTDDGSSDDQAAVKCRLSVTLGIAVSVGKGRFRFDQQHKLALIAKSLTRRSCRTGGHAFCRGARVGTSEAAAAAKLLWGRCPWQIDAIDACFLYFEASAKNLPLGPPPPERKFVS